MLCLGKKGKEKKRKEKKKVTRVEEKQTWPEWGSISIPSRNCRRETNIPIAAVLSFRRQQRNWWDNGVSMLSHNPISHCLLSMQICMEIRWTIPISLEFSRGNTITICLSHEYSRDNTTNFGHDLSLSLSLSQPLLLSVGKSRLKRALKRSGLIWAINRLSFWTRVIEEVDLQAQCCLPSCKLKGSNFFYLNTISSLISILV